MTPQVSSYCHHPCGIRSDAGGNAPTRRKRRECRKGRDQPRLPIVPFPNAAGETVNWVHWCLFPALRRFAL